MNYPVLLFQFYSLFVLIAIGYLAARLKIVTESNCGVLASLVLNITLPILIFVSLTNVSLSSAVLKNMGLTFVFSYISLILLYATGMVSRKFLELGAESKKVYLLHTMFGNIIFIAYPFISSLFPNGEGLLYATVFQFASDSVLYSWGILYFNKGKSETGKTDLKHLINPLSIAFVVSIICLLIGFKLPINFEKPFSGLGHTTVYISLIYVGYLLSTIHFREAMKRTSIWLLSFVKLLLVPILIIAILLIFNTFVLKMEFAAISAIVLQTAMPAMATVAIMAKKYGSDDVLASENIFVTTILSIITLPIIWYLLNMLFQ